MSFKKLQKKPKIEKLQITGAEGKFDRSQILLNLEQDNFVEFKKNNISIIGSFSDKGGALNISLADKHWDMK